MNHQIFRNFITIWSFGNSPSSMPFLFKAIVRGFFFILLYEKCWNLQEKERGVLWILFLLRASPFVKQRKCVTSCGSYYVKKEGCGSGQTIWTSQPNVSLFFPHTTKMRCFWTCYYNSAQWEMLYCFFGLISSHFISWFKSQKINVVVVLYCFMWDLR